MSPSCSCNMPLLVLRGVWAMCIHSNVSLPLGPLGFFLGDPALHRRHHARDLRAALRDLQDAENMYEAIQGEGFLAVHDPYPADEGRSPMRWPRDNPFQPLDWTEETTFGRHWVDVSADGLDFSAHGVGGGVHYVVHRSGEPEPVKK